MILIEIFYIVIVLIEIVINIDNFIESLNNIEIDNNSSIVVMIFVIVVIIGVVIIGFFCLFILNMDNIEN